MQAVSLRSGRPSDRSRSSKQARATEVIGDVRSGSLGDIGPLWRDVSYAHRSRHRDDIDRRPIRAMSGHASSHSITSSAIASIESGIFRPIRLAAFILMNSSNFVGCSTGIADGLVPFKSLSTNSAARRNSC